jgi:glutaredoxin
MVSFFTYVQRKKSLRSVRFAFATCCLAFSAIATADTVYKIVGPDGKVTYSTSPPAENQKANVVRMDVAAPEASKDSPVPKKKEPAKAVEGARTPWQVMKDMFGADKTETVVKKDKTTMEISKSEPTSAAKLPPAPDTTLAFSQPILFVGSACDACVQAKKFLEKNKIAYRLMDVDTADGKRARNEVGNGKDVPYLLVNGKRLKGFSQEAYEIALNIR